MISLKDQPSLYRKVHKLVRNLRGTAKDQQCARCASKPAFDWAQVHTEDGLDPWSDYIPLCKSCHAIYDGMNIGRVLSDETKARLSAAKAGVRLNLTEDQRAKISSRFKGRPKSAEHRAKIAAGRIGKKHTEETKEKIRQQALLRSANRDSQGGSK